jgi:1-acyl-sn-glycerol-3-phosphate acyltransferase
LTQLKSSKLDFKEQTLTARRKVLNAVLGVLLHTAAKIHFVGAENVPARGGVLLATNHMSRFDTLLLALTPTRPDITALVADKYKKNLLFLVVLNMAGIIWLDRTKADFGAFRVAVEALKRGYCIGIAPEGTRSTTAELAEGKPGAVLLALKAGVPIVPVGLADTDTLVPNMRRLKRSEVTLHYGKPFSLPPLERGNRDEQMQAYTDEIMCRIAALLPERHRGFYAGHARVQELLSM